MHLWGSGKTQAINGKNPDATVHLIDASAYLFRAWFSLPRTIVDRAGRPANAIYGFASFLAKYIAKPELLRLRNLKVRIPAMEVVALERVAARKAKMVDTVLSRELLDFVSASAEWLSAEVP